MAHIDHTCVYMCTQGLQRPHTHLGHIRLFISIQFCSVSLSLHCSHPGASGHFRGPPWGGGWGCGQRRHLELLGKWSGSL